MRVGHGTPGARNARRMRDVSYKLLNSTAGEKRMGGDGERLKKTTSACAERVWQIDALAPCSLIGAEPAEAGGSRLPWKTVRQAWYFVTRALGPARQTSR